MAKKKNSEKKGELTPEQQDNINKYLSLVPEDVEGLTYKKKLVYGFFLHCAAKGSDMEGNFYVADSVIIKHTKVSHMTVTRVKKELLENNLIEVVEDANKEKKLPTKYRLIGTHICTHKGTHKGTHICTHKGTHIDEKCGAYNIYTHRDTKEYNIKTDNITDIVNVIRSKPIEEYNIQEDKKENNIHNTNIHVVKEKEDVDMTKEELKVYVESVLSDLSVCSLDDLSVLEGRLTKAAKLFNEMRKEIKTLKNELNELKKENAELIKRIGLLEKDKLNKDKQHTTNVEERKKGGLSVSFNQDKVLFSHYLKQYNDTSNNASQREEALTNLVALKNAGKLSKGQCDVLDAIFNSLKAKEKELKEKQDPSSEEHEKPVSKSVFESDTSKVLLDEWKELYNINETKHWEQCQRFLSVTRFDIKKLIESHKASDEIVEMYNGILNGQCPMVDAIIKRNPKYTKEKVFEECRLKEKQTSKEDA